MVDLLALQGEISVIGAVYSHIHHDQINIYIYIYILYIYVYIYTFGCFQLKFGWCTL